jgi:D-alanine-D-alanine ligase
MTNSAESQVLKQVIVMCGGQSAEHDISVLSAQNVVRSLRLSPVHSVAVVYLDREGSWFYTSQLNLLLTQDAFDFTPGEQWQNLAIFPGQAQPLRFSHDLIKQVPCDVVFSVLHGTQGEDGAMQGLLQQLNLPYVGSGVLGSAICMAKHVAKSLLREAQIVVVPWVTLHPDSNMNYQQISEILGLELFVKPSQSGSSFGISRVANQVEFAAAIELARRFDDVVLIEKAMKAREIECSVLGNDSLEIASPGEIINTVDFYSFDEKYSQQSTAQVKTPADLTAKQRSAVEQVALATYRALGCEGFARVDLFLTADDLVWVNEVNSLPGFTNISVYPKNWQGDGVDYLSLLHRLIALAKERWLHRQELRNNAKEVMAKLK